MICIILKKQMKIQKKNTNGIQTIEKVAINS